MPKLYELTDQFSDLYQAAITAGDDPEDEVKEAFKTQLESLEMEFEQKLGGCVKILRSIESDQKACEEEAKRLTGRGRALKNRVASLSEYMEECMVGTGIRQLKTSLFTATIQLNPASVVIDDINAIPEEFTKLRPREVSKLAIKEELEGGGDVPGARLVRKESLRIR
jgi:predicted nuclease with TOPRIM domain